MGHPNVNIQHAGSLVSSDNPFPVTPAAPISSSAKGAFRISGEFTRPANTTQYTAGDVVGNSTTALTLIELANAALLAGRGGVITGAVLHKDGTTVTLAQFRVHLYKTATVTAFGYDNEAANVKYANKALYIGAIDFPTMTTGTGASNTGARAEVAGLAKEYDCEATSLFYVLEAIGAYTPASGEKFDLELLVLRD